MHQARYLARSLDCRLSPASVAEWPARPEGPGDSGEKKLQACEIVMFQIISALEEDGVLGR